jgi:hypothetical protein
LFNLSLFQFCAFRSLTKATYRVRKAPTEQWVKLLINFYTYLLFSEDLFHYNVYANTINDVPFSEHLQHEFLKFHVFVGR